MVTSSCRLRCSPNVSFHYICPGEESREQPWIIYRDNGQMMNVMFNHQIQGFMQCTGMVHCEHP